MSELEILNLVIERLLASNGKLTWDQVKLESSLEDDLGLDSLDLIELQMTLEGQFQVEIPDEQAGKFLTVQDIVEFIFRTTQDKSVAAT